MSKPDDPSGDHSSATVPSRSALTERLLAGWNLTRRAARTLERRLGAHPDDLEARLLLLGYQDRRRESLVARRNLLAWLIGHRPTLALATPEFRINRLVDEVGYRRLARLWEHALEEHPRDVRVLANAAAFFAVNDNRRAIALLRRAERLEPRSPCWPDRLALLHELDRRPRAALAALERARKLARRPPDAFLLERLARTSLSAGESRKAGRWARQLLARSASLRGDWMNGNAIFSSHSVLGQLALRRGHLAAAERHLLAAGDTPGSPQLDSFGPDLSLADALLRRGRSPAVAEFLRRCSRFWKGRRAWLAATILAIESGRRPRLDRFAAARDLHG